jgi:hypothetical protein
MNLKHLKSTTLLIAAVIAGHSMLLAAEDKPKLPQTLTVKCSLDPFPYAFKPKRKSWASVIQNVIEWNDEKMVDEALSRGNIAEAKRLAFAHAPVEQVPPPEAPRNWKPKKISIPHLRSRAKVYLAMGELEAAATDAEQVYLAANQKAGYISMRTDELEEDEALRETIRKKRDDKEPRTQRNGQ